jgi:DNA-binding winged helix-turn-helix (wHTH) protein
MIFAFDAYELDTARLEIRRDGEALPIEPQVFDVLAYLVTNRDRLVSKEELLDNVWGDRFVSESALTSRIKTARRLIGDDGSRQSLIRTVHGRGYRFVATVEAPGAAEDSVVNAPPSPRAGHPLTVGRDAELARLRSRVAAARGGERQVMFIAGAAGIGKTTLTDQLLAELEGGVVGVGQCVEHRGSGEAYLPVLEAVHSIATAPDDVDVLALLIERAPMWVLQMPGLIPPAQVDELRRRIVGGGHDRMLREMLDALHAAAQQTLVVVVLEDLHWSDASTLDLLEAIAMDRRPGRLLVIGTHRPGDAAPASRAVHALAVGLRLRGRADLITLDALRESDVAELLEAHFGRAAPSDLAALLHARTGGIPLFVERLLDSWLEDGWLSVTADEVHVTCDLDQLAAAIPDSLRQLIEHAFERLAANEQTILSAASVAGREFTSAEVAAACRNPEDDVEATLAELGRRGVFVEPRGELTWPDHTVTSRFAFEHDLHREVLYDRIGPRRTAMLHLAIGGRLEQAHRDDPGGAAALATHFLAGADAARALRYCTLAAEQQMQRSAHHEAIQHLHCAAEMLTRLPATRSRAEEELRLKVTLGNALITAKGYAAPETAAAYADARRLCEELGDGPHFLPVLYGLWNNAFVSGRHPSAHELASSFLELAERFDDDSIVVARRAVGWPLVFMGRAIEARMHLEQIPATIDPRRTAALIASYGEDPATAGRAALSWARWLTGDEAGADQASDESLHRAASVEHPLTEAYALVAAATLAQLREDPGAAEDLATRAIEVTRRHEIPFFEAIAMTPLGWARGRRGDPNATDLLRDGLAAAAATGTALLRPMGLATLGELLASRGDLGGAMTAFDDASTAATETGELFYTPEIQRLRSHALLANGDRPGALSAAADAVKAATAVAAVPFTRRADDTLAALEATGTMSGIDWGRP